MWQLYDELIEGIPEDLIVTDWISGNTWTLVRASHGGMGLSMTISEGTRPKAVTGELRGQPLRLVAEASKSWNFQEACIGVAAINSYYNERVRAEQTGIYLGGQESARMDAFLAYRDEVIGKRVTVVGHFPNLEKRLSGICQLSILERNPQLGDYPDSACEYILPEQDYVFITGTTLINKTLPRLLTLSRNAKVIMVGPSATLASSLLHYGVYGLSGFVVHDAPLCEDLVRGRQSLPIFQAGEMVNYRK